MSYTSELPSRTPLKPFEVASLFNVSPQTVCCWHGMGIVEGAKICGSLRICRSSLLNLRRCPTERPAREETKLGPGFEAGAWIPSVKRRIA
jgi:hypothetical protein